MIAQPAQWGLLLIHLINVSPANSLSKIATIVLIIALAICVNQLILFIMVNVKHVNN
jgi:hypothetical protein